MAAQLFLGHASAVILDDKRVSTQRFREEDRYLLCVGIPCVVHEFLQRSLGRGIFLTQQCGEAGIYLEAQMSTTHIGISVGERR
ncbi:hypothetical protein N879_09000 [Alcaligenes sp. EGD-AK7]|nr:hypothetical protein C660_21527 [Alcaligenes sp. HPC1271]ERI33115.1 hypothetical protein N879_09000 [Alcaligenes sp. EGD-AK7]